ncbi:MAG: ATP-binding protein [Proteobacteria bacterium]|nr:ATP-binding protein [Pseudomonadota bacterium]
MNIPDLLKQPEGKMLAMNYPEANLREWTRGAFKRDLSSVKPILKTLIAFANTAGGIVIIGQGDDGTVYGIQDVFMAEERLTSIIANSISPAMMPEIELFSHEGKSLIMEGTGRS